MSRPHGAADHLATPSRHPQQPPTRTRHESRHTDRHTATADRPHTPTTDRHTADRFGAGRWAHPAPRSPPPYFTRTYTYVHPRTRTHTYVHVHPRTRTHIRMRTRTRVRAGVLSAAGVSLLNRSFGVEFADVVALIINYLRVPLGCASAR